MRTATYCGGLASATITTDARNPPYTAGGTTVLVKDSFGAERPAPLQYVSATRINYIVPGGTATGMGQVTITTGDGLILTQPLNIQAVSPIVLYHPYDATVDYQPSPVAQLVRLRNGEQTVEPLTSQIDLGPDSDQVSLVLFGTGLRHRTSLAGVRVTFTALSEDQLAEVDGPVEYAGPQNEFAGLDQVNVRLPRSLAGSGAQEIQLRVDGKFVSGGVLFFK
jgi:uncharacterized protein (TIGR03437 family)